jgi:predicted transcriptional regulator
LYYFGDEGRAVIAIEVNGSKRRDRHDIVAEILKTAREGRIKTHIMYKAKLSYSQINAYLQLLVDKGFLENNTITRKKQTIRFYRTTLKGVHFIENIDAVNELLG